MNAKKQIAVIYPAGLKKTDTLDKEKRIQEFADRGFKVTEILPEISSPDHCTSAPILERATQLCYALTMRKFPIIMAGRGGVGTTELIPYLENLLPPVLPDKILVGFSDISFLGVYLACRYPNLKFIHGQVFFADNFFTTAAIDQNTLFDLLNGNEPSFSFPTSTCFPDVYDKEKALNNIKGICIPINLSLAENLACCKFIHFQEKNILFLEDCNEYVYRIIRKIDNLINSGFIQNTQAIVLGSFDNCLDADDNQVNREFLLKLFARKTRLPILDLPIFGHGERRFPLMMGSEIILESRNNEHIIKIINKKETQKSVATKFPPHLFTVNHYSEKNKKKNVHLTGIGGTGMAQVAGFFVEAGFKVSGSDNPIYPPMDKVIADLNIIPNVGFKPENIKNNLPDFIIMANVVSRINATLNKNEELEEILQQNIPVLSFPSALRKYFLHSSRNIIISGTHGKTTTSSLTTFLLDKLNYNPSFLIGGSPVNFKAGFALRSPDLFVLEGDEYDSAFFDKGPKFLHYEPKVCLINNIEFDHADIYPNIQAIEDEFLRLAKLTQDRAGIVVANLDDARVLKIISSLNATVIGFTKNINETSFPAWKLKNFITTTRGLEITGLTPNGRVFNFKTGVFGEHNALNCLATFAILHANQLLEMKLKEYHGARDEYLFLEKAIEHIQDFKGVKRRFELLEEYDNISIFDDFAHHPTAIATTIQAFRAYIKSAGKKGELIICFDPRNATMRRNILADDLIQSFTLADKLYLGKVPQDLRMKSDEILDGPAVAKACGEKAKYFDDNKLLLESLINAVSPGDTVVFMSSGSFDGIPHHFANMIRKRT